MCNFYKLNNEILKFDIDDDIDELRFNQWIIKKENLQRLNKKDVLEKGLFRMTVRTVESDLGITFGKARSLIKKFEKLGIIKCIEVSKSKKQASVYAYTTVYFDENNNTVQNTVRNTDNASNSNDYSNTNNTVQNTVRNTSKKENIKRELKNKYIDTSTEVKISEYLYKLILKNNSKAKKPNIQKWADVINKLMRIDGRSKEDIKLVIDYSQSNDFWMGVILSPTNLRKHFDKLYLQANKKAPAGTGADKNNSYTKSICNTSTNNTPKVEINKFK